MDIAVRVQTAQSMGRIAHGRSLRESYFQYQGQGGEIRIVGKAEDVYHSEPRKRCSKAGAQRNGSKRLQSCKADKGRMGRVGSQKQRRNSRFDCLLCRRALPTVSQRWMVLTAFFNLN